MSFSAPIFALLCVATAMVEISGRSCKYELLHDVYRTSKMLHRDLREAEDFPLQRPINCLPTSPKDIILMSHALKRTDTSGLTANIKSKVERVMNILNVLLRATPPELNDSGIHEKRPNANPAICLYEISYILYRMAQSKITGCTPANNIPMRRFKNEC